MCDIVRTNFDNKLPTIVKDLHSASFISIDCEFTGLLSDDCYKSSLFDSPTERYNNLRNSLKQFLAVQVGISAFKYLSNENKYAVSSYTFYLFPRSFSSIDVKFLCQSSSIDFLCNYKFDFNKAFYEGVSFLNNEQEAAVLRNLENKTLFESVKRNLTFIEDDIIQKYCSKVAGWAALSADNDSLDLDVKDAGFIATYFIHQEIRERFPSLWTNSTDQFHVKVRKVSKTVREELQRSASEKLLQQQFLKSLVGFSTVFQLLTSMKKPIVGHNLLLDLMMMFKQFVKPLPSSYEEFKRNITALFPAVYDTKHISYEFRSVMKKEDCWESNSLSGLYEYFQSGKGGCLNLYMPLVELEEGFSFDGTTFHESGYDAYCSGFCFVKLAHLFTSYDSVQKGFAVRSMPATFQEQLAALKGMKNAVNIIRGRVNCIRLDGPDPPSERPPLLHVEVARLGARMDVHKLAQVIAKFGMVDIKPCSRRRALIAAGNLLSARDILRHLRQHGEWRVSQYSALRHSTAGRAALWGGLLASGTLFALLLLRAWPKPKFPAT